MSAQYHETQNVIYLDHAATSFPKPPEVSQALLYALEQASANPGRGSHRMAVQASRELFNCRKTLSQLLDVHNPVDIAFTANTTVALNMAIQGYLEAGDHVISTMTEHNSVRRPLEALRRSIGIEVTYIAVNAQGDINLAEVNQAFTPRTRLLVCNHSSNLLGSILPVAELSSIAHDHGTKILVDIAQSAGHIPVALSSWQIDMAAFPGHKGLLGPQGTGGLYIAPNMDLHPWIYGGTGSQSEEINQPTVRPDRYEAGTPNTPGIAGLHAGAQYVLERSVFTIAKEEQQLSQMMIEKLLNIPNVHVLGPELGKERTGIVSFIMEHKDSAEIAFRLDREFGIAVRAGMHCTPLAHISAGTLNTGAVRASVGYRSAVDDIDRLIEAIQYIHRT
ncbi:aminotransferase class V-fold PLP-dependent enzyme [Paenibacillus sp. KACC 21273]|uniref:aminotransferase class V-fold PLP-dependent enzyme n=1 Tax=Paenibacillus sp. KACC 21273 TaxID=3025665 RepID=UPI0023664AB6|nr:aminotransferase class V-fold PLP-dependent enzyme [Paenibacillus sp. KACC 21273]WDF50886.1 aminotransferase class V-fold PLP-dependent enzyme [Paenibacillus sp. KACC 21273]